MGAALGAALLTARVVLGARVAEGQSSRGEGEEVPPANSADSSARKAPSQAGNGPPAAPSADVVDVGDAPRPGRVKLVYVLEPGTRGCDDEAFFRRMVASELEVRDPFVLTGSATHELDVHIRKDAPGFRAAVKLRTAAGKEAYSREFLERTCADAVDRAVIVSMLTVFPPVRQADPRAATEPPTPTSGAAPADSTASSPGEMERRIHALEARANVQTGRLDLLTARLEALEKGQADRTRKETKTRMDITWALSAGALITANLTPDVGPGVWLGGEGRSGPLSIGLEARVVLPSRVQVVKNDFDLSQYVLLFTPCGRYSYFFGCAVAGGGVQMVHDGSPGISPSSSFAEMLQLGGRLGAEVPFGDSIFGARAWGEVLYSTPPTTSVYPISGTSWDRPDVSAIFGLGLVIKLNEEGTR